MATGFAVASFLAAVVLLLFGINERGTAIALQVTARWSFLLFWPAYIGTATAKLFGATFNSWATHTRNFGLAYATAQAVHVGLVLWIFYLAPAQNGGMYFFWIGIACTYFLALFSLPSFREPLGPRLWRVYRTAALEYIALVFAADFLLRSLTGPVKHEAFGYIPFVIMLVGALVLRAAAAARYWRPKTALPERGAGFRLIAIGVGVVLFSAIGFGVWSLVDGLTPLPLCVVLIFVLAATLNIWTASHTN